MPLPAVRLIVAAFHEKAGRCQPVFLWWGQVHLLPDLNAILCTPSYCFCRHPSIRTLV